MYRHIYIHTYVFKSNAFRIFHILSFYVHLCTYCVSMVEVEGMLTVQNLRLGRYCDTQIINKTKHKRTYGGCVFSLKIKFIC